VREVDAVGRRVCGRAPVAAERVAGVAGAYLAPPRLCARRVALVAVVVRGEAGGYRERDAAARGLVARRAALFGVRAAAHVLRVVEAHAEVSQAGEGFERRVVRLDARVAVHAQRALRGRELRDVAVN